MKYALNPDYYFCGWDGLPFAVTSDESRRPEFMLKDQFLLLWSCDSRTDIDRDALEGDLASFFSFVIESGIVREVPDGTRLQLHEYRRYPCRYRSDVQLSITGKCNYKCRHCFQSAPHGVLGQPTTEEVCAELDQLAECGVRDVSITGGEPLIHEGFWDIIDHMQDLDLRLTTVYSNGKLVDQELLDGFAKRGLHPSWSISFDGLGQHDWIRGVEGAEESAIAAIKLLVANGYSVGCGYTLTKRTAPVFRETVKFLASIGVHSVKSGCTQAQGEWLDRPEEWLADEEYLEFYKEYIPQYLEDGRPLNLQFEGLFAGMSDRTLAMSRAEREKIAEAEDMRDNLVEQGTETCSTVEQGTETCSTVGKRDGLSNADGVVEQVSVPRSTEEEPTYRFMTERELTEEQCDKFLSCGVLGTSFYIGPTGKVMPCMGMDATPVAEEFDTLWDKPLHEILSEGSRFIEATGYTIKDVFDHNPSECAECEVRSRCASGCRASAVGADGADYLALDERTCMVCKDDWAAKVRAAIAAAGVE